LVAIEEQPEAMQLTHPAAVEGSVYAERVRLAYAFLPGAIAGSLLAVTTIAWLLAESRAMATIRAWQITIGACILVLVVLYAMFRHRDAGDRVATTWGSRYRFAAVLNGTAWGLLGLLMLREPQSLGVALFPVLVGALCAGAACALAPALSLFMMFTLPLMLGAIVTLVVDPTQGPEVLMLVAAVYALSTLAAWRMSRAIGDSSQRIVEKQLEVVDAANDQAQLEEAHAELVDELARRQRLQSELEANEVHFRALVETSGDIVFAIDAAGCYTYINGAALEAILGYRAEDVIGLPFTQFAEPATAQAFDDEFFKLTEGGTQLDVKATFLHRNGYPVHLSIGAIALRDDEGRFIGASGTAVDVSEIKAAETLLKQALAEQHAILNCATVGIAIVEDGRIIRANSELESMFGYPSGRIEGLQIVALHAVDDGEAWLSTVISAIASRGLHDCDVTCRRRDGSSFWCRLAVRPFDQAGAANATIWVVQDISDRKQKEQAIEHAALHDTLTGLPNRALLSDRLQQTIERASRANGRFGVLFVDLDRFKMVNDTIGHDGGDELLRVVAQRLRHRVRATDTVARQGGDEFIVMLPEVRALIDVERVAENLLAEIAKPIAIFGNDYVVTGSVGISLYPDHGSDAQALLRNADAAMYRAKELGKNTYRVFTEDLHLQAAEDVQLENMLRTALDLQQLTVYYQPRIDLATGSVRSLEALARWHHPKLGWVDTSKFIGVAERAGLIGRLGEWVLRRACKDLAHLSLLGFTDLGVSVNVSHSQLSDPKLVVKVRKVLKEFDIEPGRLELELTETAIARNVDQAVTIMQSLEATGIGIAIDDFGTGYSSLSQLKRFPVRTLKIDRSFIDSLPHEEDDVAIALAVIVMAKRLKMRVVAEGVETAAQRDFLVEHQCDEAQGFLFSRPAPLSAIIEWLQPTPRDTGPARRVA
jgi:diguanylate cyclase (GGDEF)-like protein/PAS domain S-box-containing protein